MGILATPTSKRTEVRLPRGLRALRYFGLVFLTPNSPAYRKSFRPKYEAPKGHLTIRIFEAIFRFLEQDRARDAR
jgi:hypothetical protein